MDDGGDSLKQQLENLLNDLDLARATGMDINLGSDIGLGSFSGQNTFSSLDMDDSNGWADVPAVLASNSIVPSSTSSTSTGLDHISSEASENGQAGLVAYTPLVTNENGHGAAFDDVHMSPTQTGLETNDQATLAGAVSSDILMTGSNAGSFSHPLVETGGHGQPVFASNSAPYVGSGIIGSPVDLGSSYAAVSPYTKTSISQATQAIQSTQSAHFSESIGPKSFIFQNNGPTDFRGPQRKTVTHRSYSNIASTIRGTSFLVKGDKIDILGKVKGKARATPSPVPSYASSSTSSSIPSSIPSFSTDNSVISGSSALSSVSSLESRTSLHTAATEPPQSLDPLAELLGHQQLRSTVAPSLTLLSLQKKGADKTHFKGRYRTLVDLSILFYWFFLLFKCPFPEAFESIPAKLNEQTNAIIECIENAFAKLEMTTISDRKFLDSYIRVIAVICYGERWSFREKFLEAVRYVIANELNLHPPLGDRPEVMWLHQERVQRVIECMLYGHFYTRGMVDLQGNCYYYASDLIRKSIERFLFQLHAEPQCLVNLIPSSYYTPLTHVPLAHTSVMVWFALKEYRKYGLSFHRTLDISLLIPQFDMHMNELNTMSGAKLFGDRLRETLAEWGKAWVAGQFQYQDTDFDQIRIDYRIKGVS